MTEPRYPFLIRPLAKDEGGGFLIEFPDLPGCVSDGETIEDAIANGAKLEEVATELKLAVQSFKTLTRRGQTADYLGISRKTLYNKINQLQQS